MDKLPCSTSFLMSINFEGLKEVIDFFHKNINILNGKINDLNLKFKGFEDIKNQIRENNIKTESSLRLLSELEQKTNNYSQNIIQNSLNISLNKEGLENIKEEIEIIKSNNNNLFNTINDLNTNQNKDNFNKEEINIENNNVELKNEIEQIKTENKEIFEKLFKKVEVLELKINKKNDSEKTKEELIDIKKENLEDNIIYKDLCNKVKILEEKINKIEEEKTNEIIIPAQNKESEIKNISVDNPNNLIQKQIDIEEDKITITKEPYLDKLNQIENKIIKLENDFLSLQLKNNINYTGENQYLIPNTNINENIVNNNSNKIIIDNKNKTNEEMKQKEEKDNDDNIDEIKNINEENKIKFKYIENKIMEITSLINELNKSISSGKYLEKVEHLKFSKKIELQLKDYNDKINGILSKEFKNNEVSKRINMTNNIPQSFNYDEDKKGIQKNNNNFNEHELIESLKSTFQIMISENLQKIDISSNSKIIEIEQELENQTNIINGLTTKSTEISTKNNNNNKNCLELVEKTKNEIKNSMKILEDQIMNIPKIKEELEFCQALLLGKEEQEKYKNMPKEERNNEISLITSVKEEITIHGNYLKKLSEGINKLNNRINNLNKENLTLIKKDLKNESNFILEDFKTGLKTSITKIEDQLRDKVDKLGLDQFWNKVNEQLIEEMKQKIDKKELNKNNMYLKKKIDNLESKISRTFVDTLIDLQMDEAPLLVKKNFREITEQKCASCGQNLQNDKNNGLLGTSIDFNNFGTNQHKTYRPRNINDKDKLPEIKTNLQK